jgi:hypothetical protein
MGRRRNPDAGDDRDRYVWDCADCGHTEPAPDHPRRPGDPQEPHRATDLSWWWGTPE